MAKCICFNRVSSVGQDIVQQEDVVFNECLKDGYSKENIIVISYKESAIKLSLQERQGLQDLMNYINTDPEINCVYCYEISRISRQPKMLYEIRDFLVERHVQLIVLKPYLKLLDIDGSLSQSAVILFSIFSSLSESEMMLKKSRMLRGKEVKKAQGCFVGGKVLFGYTTDKEKHIIIDKEKSEIVKRIYSMYLSGHYSTSDISDTLYNEGVYTLPNKRSRDSFICKVLKTHDYCGSGVYPALLSEDDYKKAEELRNNYHNKPRVKYPEHVYLAQKIIFNHRTGKAILIRKKDCTYFDKDKEICINLNAIDSLMLYCADYAYKCYGEKDRENLESKTREELIRCEKRLETYDNEESKIKSSFERLEERYILGSLSKSKLDELEKKLYQDLHKIEVLRKDDLNKQSTLTNSLNAIRLQFEDNINVYELSEKEQLEFVRKYIKKVELDKIDNVSYNAIITYVNPLIDSQIYRIYSKRHKIYLYGEEIDCVFLKRFKRK